ncbi:glyoxylase-like metal-dependent hydrolase (beta-lactamase superfamily II) [Salsuginibacillus halophilus]|uniref:Glyoxylase-like metal-dependent hydrolase (Beta-lactamase superfamily II) n=1 Tax=Salsuginibacillus halophilus TaxID=517424 RepID=A0A2P8H810_9BACI|nr:MBL fold metallo-hydrolase [Salsuginibacillus halophilus]PSL42348.1 glyoxylase-like metal-dependent hydrolase (beta-lactamase superfamily II) [Salsuginibacillus halophilus]
MQWKQLPLGPLQTNGYVLFDDAKHAVIFDPGGDAEKLQAFLDDEGLTPQAVLLTHAHFDHIGAVDAVRKTYNVPVYLHEDEAGWLPEPSKNGSSLFIGQSITAKEADSFITTDGLLDIDPFSFKVLLTPGHSPGSVSFYHEKTATVFAGDTLFQEGIGRTDLPGGDHQQLLDSIHHQLLELPEETTVAPGHGPTTTIGVEMDRNPFLNGLS